MGAVGKELSPGKSAHWMTGSQHQTKALNPAMSLIATPPQLAAEEFSRLHHREKSSFVYDFTALNNANQKRRKCSLSPNQQGKSGNQNYSGSNHNHSNLQTVHNVIRSRTTRIKILTEKNASRRLFRKYTRLKDGAELLV